MNRLVVLIVGAFTTSIGSGMTAFAVAALAFQHERSAASVGLVYLCGFAPVMLLAPLAGVLADRYDRRSLMMIGDGGSIIGLGILMYSVTCEVFPFWLALTGIALSASFTALTEPSLRATVTELVPPEQFVRSAGLLQFASSARFLVSPILAAGVLAIADVTTVLLIDCATIVVTVTCTLYVRSQLGRTQARTHEGILAHIGEG